MHPTIKSELHPRNKHRERYDFKLLIESFPALASYVKVNDYDDESIDFFNPTAVKTLNTALLKHYYQIENWNIPPNYLCPPIPGRADYIHHIADLLAKYNRGNIPTEPQIRCLDIGVGANCIYPIIGKREYGWTFVGSDIDAVAVKSAIKIIELNPALQGNIEIRLQPNPKDIFHGIIKKGERFELSICNPPFHASLAEAQAGTSRKLKNLKAKKATKPVLNFGGQNNELWCEGGEAGFLQEMVRQSREFADSVRWFSSLISKASNLKGVYAALKTVGATKVETLPMGQGNKQSRIVAWSFL